MRRLIVTTLAAALTLSTWVLTVPAAATEPDQRARAIKIAKVRYDSRGTDTGSNQSINAEWVAIKNTGSRPHQLRGWKLRDRAGHVFRFPKFKLRPGRTVRVHTGRGRNTRRHLYWRQDWYVWNNTGDRAVLRNRHGRRIDTCRWGDGDGVRRC